MERIPKQPGRLCHIDLLKCLAMYLVLAFHCNLHNFYTLPQAASQALPMFSYRAMLSACVPLFFFVNGYLLLSRPWDLKKHTRRTLTLMALTCFWILLLRLLPQWHFQEFYTWETFWKDCWQLKDGWNNQLWYLCALIGVYLVFPLLKSAFDRDRRSFYWFTGVMVLLVFGHNCTNLGMTLYNLFVKQEFYLYYNDLPFFHQFDPFGSEVSLALAYFCLGGVACGLEPRLLALPARWRNLAAGVGLPLCWCLLGTLGWRFSLYLKWTWDVVWNGYETVFTLGSVLCLYVLSLNWKRDLTLVRAISANTLGIYLLHDLIHKLLTPYVTQLTAMQTIPGTLLYAFGVLLLTLAVCLVLKKLPLIRHLL